MYRLFQTHQIRKSIPLPEFWDLLIPDQKAMKTPVPSCIESIPAYSSYKGKCILETTQRFSGDLKLTFKGVGHTANVYLDGQHLGSHYGAYGEFSFILKDQNDKTHTISVEADNSFTEESALHIDNDYYSYLGITRPVILEQLNHAYIKWLHVTPTYVNEQWTLHITASVENITGENLDLKLKLYLSTSDKSVENNPDVIGSTVLPIQLGAGQTKEFTCSMACPEVTAYMPENPVMYFVHGQLAETASVDTDANPDFSGAATEYVFDDLIERFGFREVKVSGKQILFNGVPMKIKGFNRHEDYAEFGSSVPLSAMQRDIMLIKDTGANCVRTCHYPNDERFLDLCDENGLFVWEEAHARGLTELQMLNPHFMEQSRLTITEMITCHFNHPSIFVWGLLNECASETEYGRECYAELINLVRSLDSSKPVTFASCKLYKDICLDLVDIVSYNIYPKWYKNIPCDEFLAGCLDYIREHGGANKPIIISEIGAGAIYGYRTNTRCKWSEERQVDVLSEQLPAVLDNPECNGAIIWQFADCRIDEGWFMKRPKTQNNKGVVDMYRREKLAYEKVKELFRKA